MLLCPAFLPFVRTFARYWSYISCNLLEKSIENCSEAIFSWMRASALKFGVPSTDLGLVKSLFWRLSLQQEISNKVLGQA